MAIQMHQVQSSNLQEVGYDPDTKILRVVFKGGGAYEYTGVPDIIAEGMMRTSSHGKFFNEVIKRGGYPFRKL